MVIALDADVLVHWAMDGASHHQVVRRYVKRQVARRERLGIAAQTVYEVVHVVTDPRRFEHPLSMPAALMLMRELMRAAEVVPLVANAWQAARTLELLETFGLGRKRILDTALVATLEANGVNRIATFNRADFAVFAFLEVITPK